MLPELVMVASMLQAPPTAASGSHVEATLVAEHTAASPDRVFWVGLRLRMAPGWHTYWSNPGDSGLATKISWTLPPGWQAGPIKWPFPTLFGDGTVKSYGYADEVLLAVPLQLPADAPAGKAKIAAKVSWLECEEICKPGKANLSLSVPVKPGAATTPSRDAALFGAARKLWPVEAPAGAISFQATPQSVVVSWPAAWQAQEAMFFPEAPGVVEPAEVQVLSKTKTRSTLTVPRPAGASAVAQGTAGVLVMEAAGAKKAYRVVVKS